MFRLLVAGGRNYYNYKLIDEVLTEWLSEQNLDSQEITLVHGASHGVDRIAAQWAILNDLIPEPHEADWDRFGKSAGYRRNAEMIESGIDYAILFPGGNGTANTRRQCVANSIHFREVVDDADEPVYTLY